MKLSIFTSALLAGLVTASPATPPPTKSLQERATTLCAQYASLTTGSFTLYNNLWGEGDATSGSQCTTFNSLSGSSISWSTSWTWAGGPGKVKSYANAYLNFAAKQLSAISSIPTTWSWSYSGSSVVADVAYDLFTSSSASGDSEYEIMIWLDALGGALPIGAGGNPLATVTIGGVTWKLYSGNGSGTVKTVFSFVATSAQSSFSGDLHNFLSYLTSNQGLSSSQYLKSVGAGTEPFTGSSAVFSTSSYTVSVN